MKKILLLILICLLALPTLQCQTGKGWSRNRSKWNQRDSAYFHSDVNVNGSLRVKEDSLKIGDQSMGDAMQDWLDLQLTNALDIEDYVFMKADADQAGEAVTYEGMVNYVAANGGTGGGGYKYTSFIVGSTTGAPANGDTAFIINQMAGDVIELYRGIRSDPDLPLQALNETPTNGITGYRYNSSGTIVVKPAWATNDRAYIKAVASSGVTKITLSGGESSLLTGLRAGWKMDESAGTAVNDVMGIYNGTTNATVNQTGKFGKAHSFNGSQMSTFGVDVGDLGTSDFGYSTWIYIPTLQSAYSGFIEMQSNVVSFYAMVDGDNYIRAVITFDDTNYINIVSNSAVTAGAWHNIIVIYDRDGNGTLYINGTAQTDVENVSAHSAVNIVSNIDFRIGRGGTSTWYFNGSIDDTYLFTKTLTQDEIDDIQEDTYPW